MRAWPALIVAIAFVAQAGAQDGAGWTLEVPERVELAPGTPGTLPITLAIERGHTISKDAGLLLDLAPEPGVTVKRRRLTRADAVDPDDEAPRFAVPLRVDAAGDYAVKVHLRFWLCGTKVCRPVDARRTVTVSGAAPKPPPASTPDAGVAPPADAAPGKRGR